MTARAEAAPQTGLNVWIAQGCGSCHTFAPANANTPIGPDLQESLKGQSRDYILESIVLPNAQAAAGYDAGHDARGLRAADRARRTSIRSSTSSSPGARG